jgi:CBS domain-containing protein
MRMYEFLEYRVCDVMSREVTSIRPETPLAQVEDLFDTRGFDALPVLEADGALVGIVSKLDVLRAFHFTPEAIVPHYDEIRSRPARSVMTLQPFAVDPALPLTRLLETLVATRVKSLPVVEKSRLVGMVAREGVNHALRRAGAGQRPERRG